MSFSLNFETFYCQPAGATIFALERRRKEIVLYGRLKTIKREVWFPQSQDVSTQFHDQFGSSTRGQN